jgi:hypothetical protein
MFDDNLEIDLEVIQSKTGFTTIVLKCEDKLILTLTYDDPVLGQYIVNNLNSIISDFMDDTIEEMVSYNIDEELKQLLEEEGNK